MENFSQRKGQTLDIKSTFNYRRILRSFSVIYSTDKDELDMNVKSCPTHLVV